MKKNILKKFIVLISLSFIFLGYNFVLAEETPPIIPVDIHLKIISGSNSLYDSDISVNACDSDNISETSDITTPYCAILQSGVSNVWDWSWAPGAFITSLGDISGYTTKDKDGQDVYHYWSWSLNGSEAMTGLNQYNLNINDSILLEFIDPKEEIIEEPRRRSGGSIVKSSPNIEIVEKNFSIPKALEFLSKNQKSDGSYGAPMYTDWVAISIGASNEEIIKNNLVKYFKENKIDSNIVTDSERRAMALMALGISPYDGTEINYIKRITDSFDKIQFGDTNLINDDIFALIVLKNAGYDEKDEIILKDINYIISKQESNGSFGSVDMTSASILALRGFENIDIVKDSILKAEKYLILKQEEDKGFNNSFSASWVLQSLYQNENILKAEKYLALQQQEDGGIGEDEIEGEDETRVWATSYAIPAIMHKSWDEILIDFPKPVIKESLIQNKKETITKPIRSILENKKEDSTIIENKIDNSIGEQNLNVWGHLKSSINWLLVKLGF